MAIERAFMRVVRKPWGSSDLLPWRAIPPVDGAVGELWFERADSHAPETALLLKLVFTTQPLSIQVHPDDAFARSLGQDHGKAEAWYFLSARPGAQVAIGLNGPLTPPQLRTVIEDRCIAERIQWCDVLKGDVVCIPAGTIHAIGAGLVVAEIQRRSDVTFRLFDYGRTRVNCMLTRRSPQRKWLPFPRKRRRARRGFAGHSIIRSFSRSASCLPTRGSR
ncbi:MAG: hypothetical protein B7Y12_04755 [Rhizobiales bacterium 24-66-13]|jgi:mannose-6-phosphate isomerase|uniref:class I mannose-6-phosphate isomerase n=1 Tax=Roseixanthobacter finlandensis TaxID=3119922 RepID=UPI000BCFB9A1|nr:MAG: hypothetical protein B7Y61_03265 [Rhizobiales bacterium 35-66-30]OYZ82127.1 MAG: hypothetical protein B7Y12_04755 [Rhizobiales bacterium 24-66-13]OZB11038.1 MAG: hypothetical protein B7X67_05610 [Rhizobiales bacterium 39-66-18]